MKKMRLNPEICAGCRYCEAICSLEHSTNQSVNPKKARIRVKSDPRNGVDTPIVCQQCDRPACRDACPVGAISVNPNTGAMQVDEGKCIGCLQCSNACPFHAIFVDETTKLPLICDLCGGDPGCIKHCRALPHIGARTINYVEVSEWKPYKKAAETGDGAAHEG